MRGLGTAFWKVGDQMLIDGVMVNGSWKLVGRVSGMVRRCVSGAETRSVATPDDVLAAKG